MREVPPTFVCLEKTYIGIELGERLEVLLDDFFAVIDEVLS
jgi:hypothetical protein